MAEEAAMEAAEGAPGRAAEAVVTEAVVAEVVEDAPEQAADQRGSRVMGTVVDAWRKDGMAASLLALAAIACAPAAGGAQAASARAPAAPAAPAASAAQPPELVLPVRSQQLLPLEGAPVRVAVGDPEVADVRILPGSAGGPAQVLVVAGRPGATRVQVWQRGRSQPQAWTVRVAGGVQAALAGSGQAPEARVRTAGDRAVVSGHSPSALAHRGAAAAAESEAAGGKVLDLATVGPGGVVQVEVKVVELAREVMKDVGINLAAGRAVPGSSSPWGGGFNLMPTDLLSAGFRLLYDSADFSATLRLLESNGMARVLAEPTLVALSGQSASFLAGGEVPVPESGGLGTQSVSYKPFGIGLTVTPTVLSRERIALKVAPEASELDPANGIPIFNGESTAIIPALRTRKADTTIELGDGESFVISGLVSRETIASVAKAPFLGDLPIIGAFFRSVQYSQRDRELVIVVTPRLVRPIARGVALPLPGAGMDAADTSTNAWGYYLMGPLGGQQMPGFSR